MNVLRFLPAALMACAVFAQTPKPRPEFEVASIKPSPEVLDNVKIGMRIDGSQVYFTAFSLKDYIRIANRVKDYQVICPDWVTSQRFDIAAKLPAGATREDVNDMLESLLEDRFKVKFHHDKKEFPVYALVVEKGGSKLKESNMEGVTAADLMKAPNTVAASGSAAGVNLDLGQGAYISFSDNKLEGKRLSMVRLSDFLARFVDRPVVDLTNLKSFYDISIGISPEDYRGMLIRSAISAGVSLPAEAQRLAMVDIGDSLAIGLKAAGLKLEARKEPLDVVVVDKAEHTPTDN
jgi:uncharacterized protein (TIGR03435 family)